jgi:hypothetical protein
MVDVGINHLKQPFISINATNSSRYYQTKMPLSVRATTLRWTRSYRMNLSLNSSRIPPLSCLSRTSPNSVLYKSIRHESSSSFYAHKVQSTDGRALSYRLWCTLFLSLIHFLHWFTWATWRYTLNLHSRHKSRWPMPCLHNHRTNGSHTKTSKERASACWMRTWPTSSRCQTSPLTGWNTSMSIREMLDQLKGTYSKPDIMTLFANDTLFHIPFNP